MQREGQILMELPGVKEPERVYKLIQSSAKLEFYATYTMDNALRSRLAELSETAAAGNVVAAPVDSLAPADAADAVVAENGATAESASDAEAAVAEVAPQAAQSGKTLAEMIWSDALITTTTSGDEGTKDVQIPASNYIGGACIGVANEADTAAVNRSGKENPAVRLEMPLVGERNRQKGFLFPIGGIAHKQRRSRS